MNRLIKIAATLALLLPGFGAQARQGDLPYSLAHRYKVGINLPIEELRAIDAVARRAQLDERTHPGEPHTKRLRIADDNRVSISPERNGVWETLGDGSHLWRVRVRAAGATDLHLGFVQFALPDGATLHVIGADDFYQGPYIAADTADVRFNAPAIPGDTATIELHLPTNAAFAPGMLQLGRVGVGFRNLFRREKSSDPGPGAAGACNINVACPLGQSYPNEVSAVGYYEYVADDDHNSYLCSGTLLADVPRDRRNYFITAAHCAGTATEAASMVIYWNYQSTQCAALAAPAGGYFNDDLHGATLRAARTDVDFSLVELTQAPPAAWNPYYAGWDASGAQPAATIGIHHPSGDVKKITAGPAPSTIASCVRDGPPNTHWMTGPYTQGTTENGSSGSGLFTAAGNDSRARLLIGTLTGGDAACSSTSADQPNASTDCYGKFAVAWNGASSASRLHDWLDPANSGTTSLQGGEISSEPAPAHSNRAIPPILQDRFLRR